MGNKIPWHEQGAVTCFNAAKMYAFGWYKDFQIEIDPTVTYFENYISGYPDAKNRPHQTADMHFYVFVKLSTETANGGRSQIFIMLNKKEASNMETLADQNKVVLTSQSSDTGAMSMWTDALVVGEEYRQEDWAGTGKTLIVKSCDAKLYNNQKKMDRAHVIAYIEGNEYRDCDLTLRNSFGGNSGAQAAPLQCVDDNSWHDSHGTRYNCRWYKYWTRCETFGYKFENMGFVANTRCCACM